MKSTPMIKMRNSQLLDEFIEQGYFPSGSTVTSAAATEAFNNWLERNGLGVRKIGQHSMSCLMRNNPKLDTWRNPPQPMVACLHYKPAVI